MTNNTAICKALIDHFGHSDWTLIGTEHVQVDGSDEILTIADLGIESLLISSEQWLKDRQAEVNRRHAYTVEADPLFFKAQRGEATMEEWQAKVQEIKTRFPKD